LVGGIIEFIKVLLKIYKHLGNYRILLSILGGVILGILTGLAVPELGILGGIFGSVFGIVFAYVSSNVTAIVGSSSNPISGMVIASLIVVSLIFKFLGINSISSTLAFASFVASSASLAGDIINL